MESDPLDPDHLAGPCSKLKQAVSRLREAVGRAGGRLSCPECAIAVFGILIQLHWIAQVQRLLCPHCKNEPVVIESTDCRKECKSKCMFFCSPFTGSESASSTLHHTSTVRDNLLQESQLRHLSPFDFARVRSNCCSASCRSRSLSAKTSTASSSMRRSNGRNSKAQSE